MTEEMERDRMDAELEKMVNGATAKRRRQAQLQTDYVDAVYTVVPEDTFEARWESLTRFCAAMARAAIGYAFLFAITHGWINPALGALAAGICSIWALARWRR